MFRMFRIRGICLRKSLLVNGTSLYPDLSCLSWPSCSKKVVIVNDDDGLRKGTCKHQPTSPNACGGQKIVNDDDGLRRETWMFG